MLKVEMRLEAGVMSVSLLDGGNQVAYCAFPVGRIYEVGAALMMAREKLEAEGIIKPDLETRQGQVRASG